MKLRSKTKKTYNRAPATIYCAAGGNLKVKMDIKIKIKLNNIVTYVSFLGYGCMNVFDLIWD